jgi:hypothetical protein
LEKVVIGGGISRQGTLIEGISDAYGELFKDKPELGFEPITIQSCHFHNDSNLLGAASYFASEMICNHGKFHNGAFFFSVTNNEMEVSI